MLYVIFYENGHEQLVFLKHQFFNILGKFRLSLVIFRKHFLQDAKRNYNAPPYSTLPVRAWLDNHFPGGWIGRREIRSVSSVWVGLKRKSADQTALDEVEQQIRGTFAFLRKSVESVSSKLQ